MTMIKESMMQLSTSYCHEKWLTVKNKAITGRVLFLTETLGCGTVLHLFIKSVILVLVDLLVMFSMEFCVCV